MWLSDRRTFLLLAGSALAGCGFTPAYGPGGTAAGLQNAILTDDPTEKNAYDLVERLEERFGPSSAPRFLLSYQIDVSAAGVAITTDNAVTRYNLIGAIDYVVTDARTGARLTDGRVESFTSYSATGSTVAGTAAEEDAKRRLMRLLADQIATQLLATSGAWAGA